MSKTFLRRLAWAFFCVICLLLLGTLVFLALNRVSNPELAAVLISFCYSFVGALIAARQSENWVGWLLLGFGGLCAVGLFSEQYAVYGLLTNPGALPAAEWIAGPSFWVWAPAVALLFLFVLLLFPNGRLPSPGWKWVGWADGILLLIGGTLLAINPEPSDAYPEIRNPIALTATPIMEAVILPAVAFALAGCIVASFAAFVYRFRRANYVEKQQLKWVLYAISLLALVFILNILLIDLMGLAALDGALSLLLDISYLALPAAIGVAILRYRLFDIDVIIRRTATYALVAAALLLVYLGSIVLLQQIFSRLTGLRQNEIVTVLSTLAIAALFVPLRNRIQAWIDRRFNRKKYDAQKVLADFALTVRDETDLEKLTGRLMHVVQETMEPRSVGIWFNTGTKGTRQSE